jgi:hypothetical protein
MQPRKFGQKINWIQLDAIKFRSIFLDNDTAVSIKENPNIKSGEKKKKWEKEKR